MQPTKLLTVDAVTDELYRIFEVRRARSAQDALTPAQRRIEAARLADLYELRMGMWRELGEAARVVDQIPDAYAQACAVAQAKDWDSVRYWRERAGDR